MGFLEGNLFQQSSLFYMRPPEKEPVGVVQIFRFLMNQTNSFQQGKVAKWFC